MRAIQSIAVAVALAALAGCNAERILAIARALDGGTNPTDATETAGNPDDATDGIGNPSDGGQTFGPGRVVTGLRGDAYDVQDPSMTFEELELYFVSATGGLNDIWVATRTVTTDPWGAGTLVAELSSPQNDEDPEVSVDGLTMFFSSDRGGNGLRLYVSQRRTRDTPWQTPTAIDGLGTSVVDVAPTADRAELNLVFASKRGTATDLHLYGATRPDASAAWQNVAELSALTSTSSDSDPALFDQGRGLVFSSARGALGGGAMDLFQTARSDVTSPFASRIDPVSELNTSHNEEDPWVSQDGKHILFVSDRDGASRIYEAFR